MKSKARKFGVSFAPWMLLLSTLPASLAAQNATSPPRQGNYRMKQVQIIDPAGFGKPVVAGTALIPFDWKFQSDVRWSNRGCFTDGASMKFSAVSPDGKLAVEALPWFSWQYASDPAVQRFLNMENQMGQKFGLSPCTVMAPAPAEDLLRRFVIPKLRPGKEIVSAERMPTLEQYLNGRLHILEQQAAQSRQQIRFLVNASRVRLKYDLDGQQVEEWVMAVSFAQVTSISTGSGSTQGVDCRAIMLFAMRAPQGQLEANENLFRAIWSSVTLDSQWQGEYLKVVSQLKQAQEQNRAFRAQLLRQFQQHEIETINAVTANSMQGANQAFQGTSELTRGVQPFRDPRSGSQVQLSNLHDYAWVNDAGVVVQSDDPSFNPGAAYGGNWTPMPRVQRQP
jgi:hypothetical protein